LKKIDPMTLVWIFHESVILETGILGFKIQNIFTENLLPLCLLEY